MMEETHQILPSPNPATFLFALSSEVINATWRLLPSTDRFVPRFRVEFDASV